MSYLCPECIYEVSLEFCESFNEGKGCFKLKTCKNYNEEKEKLKKVSDCSAG